METTYIIGDGGREWDKERVGAKIERPSDGVFPPCLKNVK
jgi:hypothetical protein